MASIYAKSERLKYFVKLLMDKYQIKCYFCGELLDSNAFYARKSGMSQDNITAHHLDENRQNNSPDNLVFAHRKCHLKYHRQKEIKEWKDNYKAKYGTDF